MSDFSDIFKRSVLRIMRKIDYFALYPATVNAQSADLKTVDVSPKTLKIKPITQVPIRYGIAGVFAKVYTGSTVLLGFEEGDPQKPYVSLWGSQSPTEINIVATAKVVIDAPKVELAGGNGARLARVGDIIQASVIVPGTPPTPQQVTGVIIAGGSDKVTG